MEQNKPRTLRTITLEEHFATREFVQGPGHYLAGFGPLVDQLCDLGDGRIAAMDAAGIDMQILSLTAPGVEQLEPAEAITYARRINEQLAEAVRAHPGRFAGFATLPTSSPDVAAAELERTVRDYGFKGAMINGHTRGRYLDDSFFWPILERAAALQVPLYIHPTPPPPAVMEASYQGNYSQQVAFGLATGGWGWHIETALHVMRLILSGALDRYPELQIVIGHMGEVLPFMLPRIELSMPTTTTSLQHSIGEYLRTNLHFTFAGFNWTPMFQVLLDQVGVERIMFSADYPYMPMERALSFLQDLAISAEDRERIAHGNAEHLFKL